MSAVQNDSRNDTSVDISQLLGHYDFTSSLIPISCATSLSAVFTGIGLILTLTVNRKHYSIEDDQFKHHSTKWLLGLVIFILALLNDFLGLVEATFFWTHVDKTFDNATNQIIRIFEINANLALYTFLCIACYHLKRCVSSNPQVVSFRFYLLVGFALPIIGVSLQYIVQFAVTQYTKHISHSSRVVLTDTIYNQDELDDIYAAINSFDAILHLMAVYTVSMCLFCVINLVYIIIARFKMQQRKNSCSVVNIFVIYFLIFSLTIPEIISWIATSIESFTNNTITGDKGVLAMIEASYDLLRGLALLFHELYIFWCFNRIEKSRTEIKKLESCNLDNEPVKCKRFELTKN